MVQVVHRLRMPHIGEGAIHKIDIIELYIYYDMFVADGSTGSKPNKNCVRPAKKKIQNIKEHKR